MVLAAVVDSGIEMRVDGKGAETGAGLGLLGWGTGMRTLPACHHDWLTRKQQQ